MLPALVPKAAPLSSLRKFYANLDPFATDVYPQRLSRADRHLLSQAIGNHDLLWFQTLKAANLAGQLRYVCSVLDADDYPSRYCQAAIKAETRLAQKMRLAILMILWRAKELEARNRFSSVVVCKRSDQGAFSCPERTVVLPNTVTRSASRPRMNVPLMRLGLIGNFAYELNSDAVQWFLKHCWEPIQERLPQASLRLVGNASERFSDPKRQVAGLGFIDDPDGEMSTWNALIAPIRYGGGTSVKIADALARGVPVISSEHGARGYAELPRCPLLVCSSPAAFAQDCLRVLVEPHTQAKLSRSSQQFFEANLTPRRLNRAIDEAIGIALARQSRH